MNRHALAILLGSCLTLTACGGGNEAVGEDGSKSAANRSAECPPEQKGDGIMVSSRWDYEAIQKAQNWQTEIPPRSCAGSLSRYVPEFPEGYGLAPSHRPYVMNDNQVFLTVAELPEQLVNEHGTANVPQGLQMLSVEILRYTGDEIAKLQTWMENNPDSYRTTQVDGKAAYLMGGMALTRLEKKDRLASGLVVILDDNVVVKVFHPDVYRMATEVLEPSGIVYEITKDILDRAGA